ncbi:hypothetical protein R1flu_000725 [Riccia fluitans]|uniref:rRNA methyltransferase 2, mitochondrial n=1 Tax=Riccia fluitans TaxID=41844 RepID=A0ABD1Y184_9MARC
MSGVGVPDFFFREAKRLNFVARSAFKLLEIQKKYGIINRGSSVLDLGCAPGAWLQVACQSLGPLAKSGAVVGVDIKSRKDLAKLSPRGLGFSVILSDMCPSVSGISSRDAALSAELGLCTLSLAFSNNPDESPLGNDILPAPTSKEGLLLPEGNIVIKLLEGEDSSELLQLCKARFKTTTWFRPKATRPTSREIYLIAKGRK